MSLAQEHSQLYYLSINTTFTEFMFIILHYLCIVYLNEQNKHRENENIKKSTGKGSKRKLQSNEMVEIILTHQGYNIYLHS